MKNQLQEVLTRLESQEENSQALGFEALSLIKEILDENPVDIDMLVLRMRLNADIFENSTDIIKDATFIIENDVFKKDKMIGYDWMFWVYKNVLAIPEKATETLENQLMEIHSVYDKKYQRDRKEGELLDKLALLKHTDNQEEEAVEIWYKAYKKYPDFDRNGEVGILFLNRGDYSKAEELLLTHYDWSYQYEDGLRLQYGIKLKELFDKNELDNHPTLIGLMFNIIRNEKEHFKITGNLDFFEQYYPEVVKWSEKYPNNAFIWTARAHTHFFDTKNYEKAFQAFSKLFECDRTIAFTDMSRIRKAAKKSKNDFFALDFKFKGTSNDMYSALTDLTHHIDKGKKKKKRKKYAELTVRYGEVGYNQYRAYLYDGNDDTHSNEPHIFAMLCNNYANALCKYADLFQEKEVKAKTYDLAGKIHMEGYEISPFIENLENATRDYFKGNNYKKTIECAKLALKDYQDIDIADTQMFYWHIAWSYIKLDDLENAEKYYFLAKKLFSKVGGEENDENNRFIFTAKLFLEYAVDDKKKYVEYIPELEWFLEEKVALRQEPKEHGLVSYYLRICYKETHQKEKAKHAFQTAVDMFQDADWGFYDTKCELAEDRIKELGGKAVKKPKPKPKKKSRLKKIRNIILAPFMIIALIGGIIYAASTGKGKQEKEKKG